MKSFFLFGILITFCFSVSHAEEFNIDSHDCKKDWIYACIGSKQDKYRNWKPSPPQGTIQEIGETICRSRGFDECQIVVVDSSEDAAEE